MRRLQEASVHVLKDPLLPPNWLAKTHHSIFVLLNVQSYARVLENLIQTLVAAETMGWIMSRTMLLVTIKSVTN